MTEIERPCAELETVRRELTEARAETERLRQHIGNAIRIARGDRYDDNVNGTQLEAAEDALAGRVP